MQQRIFLAHITDVHTHNLNAPAGKAIINVPREWLLCPEAASLRDDALYSAGVHPWWTDNEAEVETMLANLPFFLGKPQVVALGECGLDLLRGAEAEKQEETFRRQLILAERSAKPVILHVVRAFDRILHLHKTLGMHTPWIVHGFRGKPALARQLTQAGISLSFGHRRNEKAYQATHPELRYDETDEDF